jgi:hypothetical protein
MTTKNEFIKMFKAENPTLQKGDDEQGYTPLNAEEYEAQIEQWADARLVREARLAAEELAKQAKIEAAAKLTALGIDPKALGL